MGQAHTTRTSGTAAGTPGRRTAARKPRPGAEQPVPPFTTQAPSFSDQGCPCQAYGKSGCPYPSGKCIVCGYRVNPNGAIS